MAVDAKKYEEAYEKLNRGELQSALNILLEIFDGQHANTAVAIANIYSYAKFPGVNQAQALKFYLIAAENGNGYANYKLGSYYRDLGSDLDALKYYTEGARLGIVECAYCSFVILRNLGRLEDAAAMKKLAAKLGQPFAARDEALEMIKGRRGVLWVPIGIIKLLKLAPAIIKRVKKTEAYRRLLEK